MDENGFYNAKSFYDILHLYIDYLDGKTDEVPTHFGKLNEDTIKQLQPIRELNVFGLLTTDSQNGLINEGKNLTTYQRSYITGLMPTFLAKKLASKFAL